MTKSSLEKQYDIVIVGAGPAGLNAGMNLINNSQKLSILLVDKIIPWEKPIPCAEGIGKLGFHNSISVDPSWIRQEIHSACFHAPNDNTVTYTDKFGGYIIDRTKMQKDLAYHLERNGVKCLFGQKVSAILPCNDHFRTVHFQNDTSIKAKTVIDASGPIGCFGKKESISCKPLDLEPAHFAWVEQIDQKQDMIHIYLGGNFAPGGYAWVFPREANGANIGIVIGKQFCSNHNLKTLLDSFINKYYPGVRIIKRFAGSIPCTNKKVSLTAPRLIKTGDAASAINPISRAGIAEALLSGKLAGQYAFEMVNATNNSQILSICRKYEAAWLKAKGKRHIKLAKVKNTLVSIPDEDYNRGAAILSSLPQKDLTMSKIFRASLGNFPKLVWTLRHLM